MSVFFLPFFAFSVLGLLLLVRSMRFCWLPLKPIPGIGSLTSLTFQPCLSWWASEEPSGEFQLWKRSSLNFFVLQIPHGNPGFWFFDHCDHKDDPDDAPIHPRQAGGEGGRQSSGQGVEWITTLIICCFLFLNQMRKLKRHFMTYFQAILCLCKCCFWCLEKFMKFINRSVWCLVYSLV